jgi:hypothetical protein
MPKMGLVLQGGGALGAYEYGAVTRLVELGWQPVAVTGVSIGATTAAAIAGAYDGDICASLKRLWDAITLKQMPFWPAERQATFSMFGNPRFWRSRTDYFNFHQWTSLCDVSPMRNTLATICDFERLNDSSKMRIAVTATNVQTGDQVSFSNYVANADAVQRDADGPHEASAAEDAIAPVARLRQQLAGLVGEIDEDCAGLHQVNAVFAVDDRRNAIVGADVQEFRLELLVLANVDRMYGVG